MRSETDLLTHVSLARIAGNAKVDGSYIGAAKSVRSADTPGKCTVDRLQGKDVLP